MLAAFRLAFRRRLGEGDAPPDGSGAGVAPQPPSCTRPSEALSSSAEAAVGPADREVARPPRLPSSCGNTNRSGQHGHRQVWQYQLLPPFQGRPCFQYVLRLVPSASLDYLRSEGAERRSRSSKESTGCTLARVSDAHEACEFEGCSIAESQGKCSGTTEAESQCGRWW